VGKHYTAADDNNSLLKMRMGRVLSPLHDSLAWTQRVIFKGLAITTVAAQQSTDSGLSELME